MKKLFVIAVLAVFSLVAASCTIEDEDLTDSENTAKDESNTGNDDGGETQTDDQ